MGNRSSGTAIIGAGLEKVAHTLFSIEEYPRWSKAIAAVTGVEKSAEGQIQQATLTIDAGFVKGDVTLGYDWSGAPSRLDFVLRKSSLLKKMSGSYILSAIDSKSTKVTYELSVGINSFLPQFMVKSQEEATIARVLSELKEFIES
jgi:hypothetical protein